MSNPIKDEKPSEWIRVHRNARAEAMGSDPAPYNSAEWAIIAYLDEQHAAAPEDAIGSDAIRYAKCGGFGALQQAGGSAELWCVGCCLRYVSAPIAAPPAQPGHIFCSGCGKPSPRNPTSAVKYTCADCAPPAQPAKREECPHGVGLCTSSCPSKRPAQPTAVEPTRTEGTIASRYAAGEDIPNLRYDYGIAYDAVHAAIRKTLGYLLSKEAAEPAVPVAGEPTWRKDLTEIFDWAEPIPGGSVEGAFDRLGNTLKAGDEAVSQVEALKESRRAIGDELRTELASANARAEALEAELRAIRHANGRAIAEPERCAQCGQFPDTDGHAKGCVCEPVATSEIIVSGVHLPAGLAGDIVVRVR